MKFIQLKSRKFKFKLDELQASAKVYKNVSFFLYMPTIEYILFISYNLLIDMLRRSNIAAKKL